ncbi:hypothetical protein ACTFIT_007893 [Dictyostelium discoideum]
MKKYNIIIFLVLFSSFLIKTIKSDFIKGFLDLSEKSNGIILYKTNSKDFLIASSFEGELFKIQVSTKSIILKSTFNDKINLLPNEKSSGFLDEKNNLFYLASTLFNRSIQISIFSAIDLKFLTSIFIYNENIPFNENCLFLDNELNLYFISTNSIYKLKYDDRSVNLKIIQNEILPTDCIIPSSSVYNLNRNLLLLGCTSKYGTLYEINMKNLSTIESHIYYYGEGIDTLLIGPKNSFSFLEGTQNYPYHLVSFTFRDIESSVYRNRETYFGKPISASSDNERFALFIFSHDILLLDLTDSTGNYPYDIDYLEEVIGLSSVYNSKDNTITISTNSSRIFFYQIPITTPQDSIQVESFFMITPLLIVLLILIIFSIKLIYSKCCKIRNDQDEDDRDEEETILKNEEISNKETNNIIEFYKGDYKLIE